MNAFRYGGMGLLVAVLLAQTQVQAKGLGAVSLEERAHYIESAQLWHPTDIPKMDLFAGPEQKERYDFEQDVHCTLINEKPGGATSKFHCRRDDGTRLKVRYDWTNGEVYAMPAATRLLWALGFGAVSSWPARVHCTGCSDDPFSNPFVMEPGTRLFHPATIDVKIPGAVSIRGKGEDGQIRGWAFSELNRVDPAKGGAPREHVDALKLLAAFIQHGDNGDDQQDMICLPGGVVTDASGAQTCTKPFLYLMDVGATFGGSEMADERASMNIIAWSRHPVWSDRARCIAYLETPGGSLRYPKIGEKGRAFLSALLDQLSDRQIADLFSVGRANKRNQYEDGNGSASQGYAPISEWVRIFKKKRAQIDSIRCPE